MGARYDTALATICEPLGVAEIPRTKYRRANQTCAVQTLEHLLKLYGPEHVTLVLRSIAETENNGRGPVAPTIWAMSDMVRAHPTWAASMTWLEMLDCIDLQGLAELARQNRKAVKLRPAIGTMLFAHAVQVFDA